MYQNCDNFIITYKRNITTKIFKMIYMGDTLIIWTLFLSDWKFSLKNHNFHFIHCYRHNIFLHNLDRWIAVVCEITILSYAIKESLLFH